MNGPAGVLALVVAETVAGGAAFLFLTPLWREVRQPYGCAQVQSFGISGG